MRPRLRYLMPAATLLLALALSTPCPAQGSAVDDRPPSVMARVAGGELAEDYQATRSLLQDWLAAQAAKPVRRRGKRAPKPKGNGASAAAAKLADILDQARAQAAPDSGRAFKAAFIAYAEGALQGLRLAATGDADSAAKGRRFVELAMGDLDSLGAGLAAGSTPPGAENRGNIGFDLSAGGYTNYTNIQLGASYGRPLGPLLEAGGGVHLGLENSGVGDYASTTLNIGVDLYGRANFYGAFGTPLVVPFAGAHMGLNGSIGGTADTATAGGTFVAGPQAGLLFYATRSMGINLMGQLDFSSTGSSTSSTSSSGGSSDSSSSGVQFLISAGLRFML